jgi:hypothetical protein
MIVQIAGTSGSGKTHVVRELMDWVVAHRDGELYERFSGPDHKTTIGYDILSPIYMKPLHVVGSYEAASGGCDSIKDVSTIYEWVRDAHERGHNVLFEGLFAMNQTRGPAMARELPGMVTVLLLTTPLATCFASIDDRRSLKGLEKLPALRHKNTKANYVRARNYTARMREAGARVYRVSREEALPRLWGLLMY